MLREDYDNILHQKDVRNSLIDVKSIVSQPEGREAYLDTFGEETDWIARCLADPDPKIRKNAAAILGYLHLADTMEVLYDAYEAEQTRYVRSTYVKALAKYDCTACLDRLLQQANRLTAEAPPQEEEKHVREETQAILGILKKYGVMPAHAFAGYTQRHTVILQTLPAFIPVVKRLLRERYHASGSMIQVQTADLKRLLRIRPVEEFLFAVPCRKASLSDAQSIADALHDSGFLQYLRTCLPGSAPWYFRLELRSRTISREDAALVRQTAVCIERTFGGALINAPSGYEITLCLMPKKDGTYLPLLKFSALPDERFSYRLEASPGDLRPFKAAGLLSLARPFMKRDAAVLDAFCAGGVLLIERQKLLPVRAAAGVDISEAALAAAQRNTAAAGLQARLIQRDFLHFSYKEPFDEILADLPRGLPDRQQTDDFYRAFFDRIEQLLSPAGIVICHSYEQGIFKKQLRLHKQLRLMKEYAVSAKQGEYVFILTRSGNIS